MARSSSYNDSVSSALSSLEGNTIHSPVLGNLLLTEEIGRGGYGIVYRALTMNEVVPREFAVKCIYNPDCNGHLEHLATTEFTLHRACSNASPHILSLADVYIDDDAGITYIITELCTGDLLEKVMREDFMGHDELIRSTYLQIIDAVQACHNMGVYHRDLKPENIFRKKDGSYVLGDFGLATTSKRTRDFYTGSEPFMSPEVLGGLRNEQASFSSSRADIWALGVILLTLITARLPWVRARACDTDPTMHHPPPGDYGYRCSLFERFLRSPENYFCTPHSHFGLSRAASDLLTCIFMTDPRKRILLHELRKSILTIRTFYANPADHALDLVAKVQQQPQRQRPLLPRLIIQLSSSSSDYGFGTDSSSLSSMSSGSSSGPTYHDVLMGIGGKYLHRVRYASGLINEFPKVPGQEPAARSSSYNPYIPLRFIAPAQPPLNALQPAAKQHTDTKENREASLNDSKVSVHSQDDKRCDSDKSVYSELASGSDSDGPYTPETHAQYVGIADVEELDISTMESSLAVDTKSKSNIVFQAVV